MGGSMSPLHRCIDFCSRVLDVAYTVCVRGSFAAWGRGSRIARRARLVSPQLIAVGSGVSIGESAWLNAKDERADAKPTLRIGDGVYIGRFVQINAWRSVVIGDRALIADRVFISD